ncbi:replication factor C like AAA ATpase [Cryptosporidium ryanae]|uniref:replication factor C like AAA ATpase n=1 Tax=Cryptosporidium ryanae TaxID=515981 RepID=UPI00351A5E06|nr:replication factor C like AAA ATpase [Cryptosporidium ryanae]
MSNILWVEKYRPKNVVDISHQVEVVKMLKHVLISGNMPHLLFYGPPGTGKTSAILALTRELFGPNEYRNRILELNASDERGINVVREKIKTWTRQIVQTNKNHEITGKQLPSWKVVILDEAEMMTSEAQSALRRIIEMSAKNTRFVIICNYISKIIEPLASRCAKFRFQPISVKAQIERLKFISEKENIEYEDGLFDSIVNLTEGDLRRGITILQSVSELFGREQQIGVNSVVDIAGIPPNKVIERILKSCTVDGTESILNESILVANEGWDVSSIIRLLAEFIIKNISLDDSKKAFIMLKISEADIKISDGSNEFLTILSLLSSIQTIFVKKA